MWMSLSLLLTLFLPQCLCVDLTYYVEEGQNPGALVGDLAADAHLMDGISRQESNHITFSQMQSVTGSSQLFRVSESTGKLYTIQILDAETLCVRNTECFKMVDVAVRRGETFMKILEIKVVIKDINDHQPEFPNKQVTIQFSEDDSKGVRRSIPNAIDRDVGILNSQVTYQLENKVNEPFTLSVSESVDGTSDLSLTLQERLDREVKDSYMIQVIAKDGGSPPKQSVLEVLISVTDVNDNIPVFSQNVFNVSVGSEDDGSLAITVLSAVDLDSGKNGKISYHFSSQTSDIVKTHFKLNDVTGEIFLQKKFTSGQKLTYKLYVKATDGGNPPLSSITMVLVNVINQQNNAPTIDVNLVSVSTGNTTTISEDIKVGSFIAYVKVTDHDIGKNGIISCDLQHEKFQLQKLRTNKYKVIVKNPVDRETKDHHDISIVCQDKGSPPLHSESKFSIQVMDVNDERPQFSKEIFKFSIQENQKSKISVGFINATDPDFGPGGKLTYSLITDSKHFLPFIIKDDGLISTVMSLDHEFQKTYKFKVMVKDNGIPSLNNSVNVIVEVKDENDNSPYFTFPSINPFTLDIVYYPYHTNNITVLKASDSDSQKNAFLRYEITGGNGKQLFTIDHYSGLLSFARVVTPHDAGTYDLQFVVKDSGTPVRSANTSLSLKLAVSNKTSEMLNAVYIQSDDTVHLYLLIVIVLVSVSVSVPITASVSICIIRCNDKRNAAQRSGLNPSNRCIGEQRHLMCPSYQTTSWPDVSTAPSADQDIGHSTLLTGSKRGRESEDDSKGVQKSSTRRMKLQSSDYQEIGATSRSKENEQKLFMTPDCRGDKANTQSDCGDLWNKGDMVGDLYSFQYYNPPTSLPDQLKTPPMKPVKETFNCPVDTLSRCLYKSDVAAISQ